MHLLYDAITALAPHLNIRTEQKTQAVMLLLNLKKQLVLFENYKTA